SVHLLPPTVEIQPVTNIASHGSHRPHRISSSPEEAKSTVRGVMSDDVVRFFNLLTTTQFWATMAYLSREYWKRRCWAITKSMENEIVVEAFMNFRTHTR
ncbi:unnamed protein product, partial [Brassica rapa]